MATDVEHAALENRKESRRAGADDRDIGVVKLAVHEARLNTLRHHATGCCRDAARQAYKTAMTIVDLPDETTTAALAARIARLAMPGDVIALSGELGAGKTSFARAFIQARGGTESVPSPTFTLVQTYALPGGAVWHFDLYRVRAAEEAWELGIEDAFRDGISLIEWPERLGSLLPVRRLGIALDFGPTPGARRAALAFGGDWAARLSGIAAEA
jgi:tRNA threonylcarbamoyladenosine biosynthesis protein TsaE